MCPQPLSRVNPTCNYVFGSHGLAARPNEAALVACIIAAWSAVEAHLGHVFGALIGAKTPTTMAMYSALQSFDAKKRLLDVTAKEILSIRYYDILIVVLRFVTRQSDVRNKFAHGIWGSAQDLPGILLLADPKVFWDFRVSRIRYWKRVNEYTGAAILNQPSIDRSQVFVYTNKELIKIHERMDFMFRHVEVVYEMILNTRRRPYLYQMLCRETPIRKELEDWAKSQGRSYRLPRVLPE